MTQTSRRRTRRVLAVAAACAALAPTAPALASTDQLSLIEDETPPPEPTEHSHAG